MAKIGILTFHRPCNFGANIQAYTNMLYLQSLGHDVKIIDYERDIDRNYNKKVCAEQVKAHFDFVQTKLNLTAKVVSPNGIADIVKQNKFDYVLIGADAVWSKGSNKDFVYFAKWVEKIDELKNLKICSISAAQMGQSYTDTEMVTISDCLSRFQTITVRDSFSRQLVRKACPNKEVQITPDPVFMLSGLIKDDWKEKPELKEKQYVLMTLPDNWYGQGKIPKLTKWFDEFKKEINNRGFLLVELPIPEGISGAPFDYTIPYPIDPIQWFLTIKHAKAFCGIRFHSIVSCISNEVPFFSLDTYSSTTALVSRLKYNFRLYPIFQPFEKKSKIRNLLREGGLDSYRLSTSINVLSPRKLADKLLNMDLQTIRRYKEERVALYHDTITKMLKEC